MVLIMFVVLEKSSYHPLAGFFNARHAFEFMELYTRESQLSLGVWDSTRLRYIKP